MIEVRRSARDLLIALTPKSAGSDEYCQMQISYALSFSFPSSVSSKFAALTSRWMIFRVSCMYSNAESVHRAMCEICDSDRGFFNTARQNVRMKLYWTRNTLVEI